MVHPPESKIRRRRRGSAWDEGERKHAEERCALGRYLAETPGRKGSRRSGETPRGLSPVRLCPVGVLRVSHAIRRLRSPDDYSLRDSAPAAPYLKKTLRVREASRGDARTQRLAEGGEKRRRGPHQSEQPVVHCSIFPSLRQLHQPHLIAFLIQHQQMMAEVDFITN